MQDIMERLKGFPIRFSQNDILGNGVEKVLDRFLILI